MLSLLSAEHSGHHHQQWPTDGMCLAWHTDWMTYVIYLVNQNRRDEKKNVAISQGGASQTEDGDRAIEANTRTGGGEKSVVERCPLNSLSPQRMSATLPKLHKS